MSDIIELGSIVGLDEAVRELEARLAERNIGNGEPLLRLIRNIMIHYPAGRALVIPSETRIEGDLVLDDVELAAHSISTIAILGDLMVEGAVMNEDPEAGPFLIVDGDLEASHVIKGGSGMAVFGSLATPGLVFCDSGYGTLVVGGNVNASAVIANDQEVHVVGAVNGVVVSDELANMRQMLVPEVFEEPDDETDEWPDGDLIRERLAAGLPVLKGG